MTDKTEKRVRWDGLRFALPSEIVDETVLTFVDKSGGASLSVTVSQDKLAGGKPALLRYVDDQIKDIKKEAPGFSVTAQTERAVGGLPGLHVRAVVDVPGAKRVQHQLYILIEKQGRVAVAVVTATERDDKRAAAVADQVAASFALDADAVA